MHKNQWIGLIGATMAVGVLIALFSSPSSNQFVTQFTEVASYRNPNNTGPVKRIYLVTVSQEDHAEMRAYGGLQPHSKYGTTTVYFFPEGTSLPSAISPASFPLPPGLNRQCLARYRRLAQGQERYEQAPINE